MNPEELSNKLNKENEALRAENAKLKKQSSTNRELGVHLAKLDHENAELKETIEAQASVGVRQEKEIAELKKRFEDYKQVGRDLRKKIRCVKCGSVYPELCKVDC